MSNLSIEMTGPKSARISFTANQEEGVLVAGDQIQHIINISDGQFLRRIQGEMFRLKESDRDFNVALKLGDSPRLNLHTSLWHDLNDALLAFIFNISVGDLLEAA